MTKWILQQTDANIPLMMKTLRVSGIMAAALAHRGIRSRRAAAKYLMPDLRFLEDAKIMKGMETACDITAKFIRSGEPVVVYGDYDADGVTSSAILIKTLKIFGADVTYYIPRREEEGYGLNLEAARFIAAGGAKLLITCDNGIAALNEIKESKNLGLSVVVIDHHEPGSDGENDLLPPADAVVDPKQRSCPYIFKEMCAAGLAYRFSESLHYYMGKNFSQRGELLALAAVGTVCDVVPLLEENRIIVRAGLDIINKDKKINLGLNALMRAKNIDRKILGVFDMGFIIGPCINASGRLSHAEQALRLFITDDPAEADEIAKSLAELNELRKTMTAEAAGRAEEMLTGDSDNVLLLFDENLHESIAGIVAGRIKERINRPVIMFTKSGGLLKGSARSIEGYNIFEALYGHKEMFTRFGGHAMAAGMTMPPENLNPLREALNAECGLTDEDLIPKLKIDAELTLEDAIFELARELNFLAPFGRGNPQPLFCARGILPESLRMMDDKRTMIFSFYADGKSGESCRRKIKGVCFGQNDRFKEEVARFHDEYEAGKIFGGVMRGAKFVMDVVYALEINDYNNNVTVQMDIKDFRLIPGEN